MAILRGFFLGGALAVVLGARLAHAAALPSEAHLRYHEREIIALVCWGLNPYTGQEWGFGNVPPRMSLTPPATVIFTPFAYTHSIR